MNLWKHRLKFSNYYLTRTLISPPSKATELDQNVAKAYSHLSNWVIQFFWIHTKETTKWTLHLPQQSVRHIQQNTPPFCLLKTPDPSCPISAATYEPEQILKISSFIFKKICFKVYLELHATTTQILQWKTDTSEIFSLCSTEFFPLTFFP